MVNLTRLLKISRKVDKSNKMGLVVIYRSLFTDKLHQTKFLFSFLTF